MSTPRIPREILLFNSYIANTNNRQLATNPVTTKKFWEDYGWTTIQSAAFKSDCHDEWVNNVYPLYSNPVTSTSIVKADTHNFIKNFITFANTEKLLDKIVSCGLANTTDATIWRLKLEKAAPTHHTEKITAQTFAQISTLGRGKFDIHVRAAADASRSSIPREAGADSVQYAWAVVDKPGDGITDLNDKLLTRDISRKAHFELDAGSINQSKWLVIYFRWYNTSFPAIAGDWSTMILVAIG